MASLRKSKSILITSTKGGVGKSIFTLNLAGIFSTIEKKVLIIDLDLTSGIIAMALNKPYNKSIYEMSEDIKNNVFDEFENYVLKYNNYIDCIACPKDPRDASKIDLRYVDMIINQAYFKYDVILIDTNHNLSPINLFLMDKIDEILFVVNNDPLNLKSNRSLISILNNIGINNYHVLLNNSNNPYKDYFSMYDIKNILQANVDYTLSNTFYIENIDKLIMAGDIVTLSNDIARIYNKDYTSLMNIAMDLTNQGSDIDGKK
ncbi:MAG: AAA family ATPase [Bacilli bacterium]|nr:AAA family ATPase [Bacilli bacterium]